MCIRDSICTVLSLFSRAVEFFVHTDWCRTTCHISVVEVLMVGMCFLVWQQLVETVLVLVIIISAITILVPKPVILIVRHNMFVVCIASVLYCTYGEPGSLCGPRLSEGLCPSIVARITRSRLHYNLVRKLCSVYLQHKKNTELASIFLACKNASRCICKNS